MHELSAVAPLFEPDSQEGKRATSGEFCEELGRRKSPNRAPATLKTLAPQALRLWGLRILGLVHRSLRTGDTMRITQSIVPGPPRLFGAHPPAPPVLRIRRGAYDYLDEALPYPQLRRRA